MEEILKDYKQRAKDYLSEPESIVVMQWMEDMTVSLKEKALECVPEEREVDLEDKIDEDNYSMSTEQDIGWNACRQATLTKLIQLI